MAFAKARKDKKELTPQQQKIRTALNWVVNILCIVIIIFALVVAIFTIVRSTNSKGVTNFFGKVYMSVRTDSMAPSFYGGDMIVCNEYNGDGKDLKVGQVITFKGRVIYNGQAYEDFQTHRIIHINENGTFRTRGDAQGGDWKDYLDNDATWDGGSVAAEQIVATWGSVNDNGDFVAGKVNKGMGKLGVWMQDPEKGKTRFFCLIVLPLILLFIAYAYALIRTLVIAKIEKEKVAKTAPVSVDELSEEEKRRLAEEYLASIAKENAAKDDASVQDTPDVEEEAQADDAASADPETDEEVKD